VPYPIRTHGNRLLTCFWKGEGLPDVSAPRQHYEIYKARCEAQNIPVQTQAIPQPIWKAINAEKDAKGKKQTTLDDSLVKMLALQQKEFTKEGAVDAVVRLIVLDDQVSTHPSHVRIYANSTH
jgi:hypothetical protein